MSGEINKSVLKKCDLPHSWRRYTLGKIVNDYVVSALQVNVWVAF